MSRPAVHKSFNPLPNDNSLPLSKFKAFADNKIIATKKMQFVLGRIEIIVGKEENVGYKHFSFSHNVFKMLLFKTIESWDCVGMGEVFTTQSRLLITLRKKSFENMVGNGKMLVTSIFSISHNVFHPIKYGKHFCNISFVVCKCFQFSRVQKIVI